MSVLVTPILPFIVSIMRASSFWHDVSRQRQLGAAGCPVRSHRREQEQDSRKRECFSHIVHR
ncbi:hypothetical protein BCR44DRAFT_1431971 [Catenaria anguillulae PL171]|uniref:Uncharacterized protein n=1 Tax=Catenaria anguillulae PL171 TaxID=765915 RepID=A0A1Y2HQM3_9FUNG|nr:hypothetical protein BCR44DRAFT_1431971 [Catenaria anguillulae PL171]